MFIRCVILSIRKTKESIVTEEEILEKFKIFGRNIQKYRNKKGLTIKELSLRTGITERQLKRIELGIAKRVNVSHIFKVAKGLEILPHELCE